MTYFDELKAQTIKIKVEKKDFAILPEGELLTKLAAHYGIKRLEHYDKPTKGLAVKYQVLSKQTAFIGVVKQADKIISSEELKTVSITEASLATRNSLQPDSYSDSDDSILGGLCFAVSSQSAGRGGRGGAMKFS